VQRHASHSLIEAAQDHGADVWRLFRADHRQPYEHTVMATALHLIVFEERRGFRRRLADDQAARGQQRSHLGVDARSLLLIAIVNPVRESEASFALAVTHDLEGSKA